MNIALDVMGGDLGPREIITGAVEATVVDLDLDRFRGTAKFLHPVAPRCETGISKTKI